MCYPIPSAGSAHNQVAATELPNFPYWFSTKYLDDETGMCYYGYRFYSPGLGRWLNRDPIGEHGGSNVYAFSKNAGCLYVDSFGLATLEFLKKYDFEDAPMAMKIGVRPRNIASGCELNFIQLTLKGREWIVDRAGLARSVNEPFYYDSDWLRKHEKLEDGGSGDLLNSNGDLLFFDGTSASTYFYLFAVERCCTKYYKNHKTCNCCEESRATIVQRFYWHTVTGRSVLGTVTEEIKQRMDTKLKELVPGKKFYGRGCAPYEKDNVGQSAQFWFDNPGVRHTVEIIY